MSKTKDGGVTWQFALAKRINDISFANYEVGFATSSEGIYKTVDEGES
jgi:hypothetical protein